MRMLLDARPLREGCLFVVALKAAAGAPRGEGGISSTNKKDNIFKSVHPSLAPGPFWPNSDADRTLTTMVRCVVRRGRESGHGSPKGRAPWVSHLNCRALRDGRTGEGGVPSALARFRRSRGRGERTSQLPQSTSQKNPHP